MHALAHAAQHQPAQRGDLSQHERPTSGAKTSSSLGFFPTSCSAPSANSAGTMGSSDSNGSSWPATVAKPAALTARPILVDAACGSARSAMPQRIAGDPAHVSHAGTAVTSCSSERLASSPGSPTALPPSSTQLEPT